MVKRSVILLETNPIGPFAFTESQSLIAIKENVFYRVRENLDCAQQQIPILSTIVKKAFLIRSTEGISSFQICYSV
jgi:hypothetical protein